MVHKIIIIRAIQSKRGSNKMPKVSLSMTIYQSTGNPDLAFLSSLSIKVSGEEKNLQSLKAELPSYDGYPNCHVHGDTLTIEPSFSNVHKAEQDAFLHQVNVELDDKNVKATAALPRRVVVETQSIPLHCVPEILEQMADCGVISNDMRVLLQETITRPRIASLATTPADPLFSPLNDRPYATHDHKHPEQLEPGSWWLEPGSKHYFNFSYITPDSKVESLPFPRFTGAVTNEQKNDLGNMAVVEAQGMFFPTAKVKADATSLSVSVVEDDDVVSDDATVVYGYPITPTASSLAKAIQRTQEGLAKKHTLPDRFFKSHPTEEHSAMKAATLLSTVPADLVTEYLSESKENQFAIVRKR